MIPDYADLGKSQHVIASSAWRVGVTHWVRNSRCHREERVLRLRGTKQSDPQFAGWRLLRQKAPTQKLPLTPALSPPPPNLPRKQGRSGRGSKSPLPRRERVRVRVRVGRFCPLEWWAAPWPTTQKLPPVIASEAKQSPTSQAGDCFRRKPRAFAMTGWAVVSVPYGWRDASWKTRNDTPAA